MEAVAAGDHVALELLRDAVVHEANPRAFRLEVVHGHVVHLEKERQSALEPGGDQVLHDLGLAVDHDRASVCELAERNVVALAVELEVDPVVDDPLAIHARAHACVAQQLDRSLLEHAGANPVLDVVAVAVLEHDRLDAGHLEQAREHETRGTGADDPDLCPHSPSSASTLWKTWKALFAAGTPQ